FLGACLLLGISGEGSRDHVEWWSWTGVEESASCGACLLLGISGGGLEWRRGGEKRMAGNSGLNATVSAESAGKMMVLLGLWGFALFGPCC
nr:hypothetical protein [Tanacetum cinerariifolium]